MSAIRTDQPIFGCDFKHYGGTSQPFISGLFMVECGRSVANQDIYGSPNLLRIIMKIFLGMMGESGTS